MTSATTPTSAGTMTIGLVQPASDALEKPNSKPPKAMVDSTTEAISSLGSFNVPTFFMSGMPSTMIANARPAMISSGMLVMPKFWTSTPMVQVHSTQLEPTDRSMPAGNQGAQHAGGDQAVDGSCLKMFMILLIRGNLSGIITQKMRTSSASAIRVPSFCKSSFPEFFFFISV